MHFHVCTVSPCFHTMWSPLPKANFLPKHKVSFPPPTPQSQHTVPMHCSPGPSNFPQGQNPKGRLQQEGRNGRKGRGLGGRLAQVAEGPFSCPQSPQPLILPSAPHPPSAVCALSQPPTQPHLTLHPQLLGSSDKAPTLLAGSVANSDLCL